METVLSLDRSARVLLVHHVAKRFGVSPRTVRWWAATGRIVAFKRGPRIWYFRETDVTNFFRDPAGLLPESPPVIRKRTEEHV